MAEKKLPISPIAGYAQLWIKKTIYGQMFDPMTYYNKAAFLSYLKYTNEKIRKLVNVICVNDPNSIVM